MRRTALTFATTALVGIASLTSLADADERKAGPAKCKKGQVLVKVKAGKGKKAKKRCMGAKPASRSLNRLLESIGERGVPKRQRRFLKTRVAKRLRKQKQRVAKEIAKAPGQFSKAFEAAAAGAARMAEHHSSRNVDVITDTGRTKTTKTVEKQGDDTSTGGPEDKDVTTTLETETTDHLNGETLVARNTEVTRLSDKFDSSCTDDQGRLRGRFRYLTEKVDSYPKPGGGRVVIRTVADYRVKFEAQVDDSLDISGLKGDEDMRYESSVKDLAGAGGRLRTVSSSSGSATAHFAHGGLPQALGYTGTPVFTTAPADLVPLQLLFTKMRVEGYFLWGDELRGLDVFGPFEQCVKVDASPASMTLAPGDAAGTTATLTRRGSPFGGPLKARVNNSTIAVAPGSGTGPTASFTVTRTQKGLSTCDEMVVEHVSNQGRGSEVIQVCSKDKPPPVGGPPYAGSISGSTLDSSTGLELNWSGTLGLGYRARYPVGQNGAPPGDYWYYAGESGTVTVTLHKPAASASDCSWEGTANLAITDPGGPSSSVQADDATPAYFLLVEPTPGQSIPFEKLGPSSCAGTGSFPVYGYLAWAHTPTAKQSGSTALMDTASRNESNKAETWTWNLTPAP